MYLTNFLYKFWKRKEWFDEFYAKWDIIMFTFCQYTLLVYLYLKITFSIDNKGNRFDHQERSLRKLAKSFLFIFQIIHCLAWSDQSNLPQNVTISQASVIIWCKDCQIYLTSLWYHVHNKGKLGEFTMVSQPIRLILVDWFVFHFFLGHLQLFFWGCLEVP